MSEPRGDLLASLAPIARALRRIEDAAAADADLTMWQYAILSVIDEAPGMNQGSVAKRLDYSPNRIVADLDHLERRRLVTRRPGPDRRANLLTCTAAGTRVMRQIRVQIHRREDELLSALTVTQQRALTSAVRSLAKALRAADS